MKIFFKAGFFLSISLVILSFSGVHGYGRPSQVIVTDKPYYSFEDTIRYAVLGLNQSGQDTARKDIYYVELWDSENQLLQRHIHRFRDNKLYGSFLVITDQKSGWYILRAYPKTPGKNEGETQVHLPILVFQSGTEEQEIRDYLMDGFSRKEWLDSSLEEMELEVHINQEIQEIRHEIQCTVTFPEDLQKGKRIPLIASAYFEEFFPSLGYDMYNSLRYGFEVSQDKIDEEKNDNLQEGLILRGLYELPEEDRSKIFAMVTLSHLGLNPGILYNYTNLRNEFSFDINDMQGDVSAYLSVLDGRSDRIRILPDVVPDLNLDYSVSDKTEWLIPLLLYQGNRKVQRIIDENYSSLIKSDTTKNIAIYDTTRIYPMADRSYALSDYVAFKDVRELIVEILPYVKISEENGSYKIFIVNNQNPDLDTSSPLYLVNGIPTRDADFIAGLDVSNIDIVEVLYSKEVLYPFNWLGKGGILAIYTKAPVRVPNYILHTIKGIYPDQGNFQLNKTKDGSQLYAPQIEPAIFWNPRLNIEDDGSITFNFLVGDQTGLLNVCLFGIGTDGEIIYGKDEIQINTFLNKETDNR